MRARSRLIAAAKPSRRGSTPPDHARAAAERRDGDALRRAQLEDRQHLVVRARVDDRVRGARRVARADPDEVRVALAERVRDAREPVVAHGVLADDRGEPARAPQPGAPARAAGRRRGSAAAPARPRSRTPAAACRAPCRAARWRRGRPPIPTSACADRARSFDELAELLERLARGACALRAGPSATPAARARAGAPSSAATTAVAPVVLVAPELDDDPRLRQHALERRLRELLLPLEQLHRRASRRACSRRGSACRGRT